MIIIAEVSELTRKIKLPTDRVISVNGDYQVDGIAFKLPATYEGDFDFSTAAVRVHWTGVDKVEHTNLITEEDGNGYPLWIMPSELTQGGHGVIEFAVSFIATDETAAVTKRWISDPVSFRNRRTVNGSSEDEAEEETIYDRLASAIAAVRAAQASVDKVNEVLAGITNSSPVVVATAADLSDLDVTKHQLAIVRADGYLYYYDGSAWQKGIKYGSYELDTTLTESGKAADAAAVGAEVSAIKEDLSEIRDRTKNELDINDLVGASIELSNGELSGTANAFSNAFANGIPIDHAFEENTQYTLSFDAYCTGTTTTGNGLRFVVKYTDDSQNVKNIPNSTRTYQHFTYTTASNKTISYIGIGVNSGTSNTWHLKAVQIEKGNKVTEYVPYYSAVDYTARAENSNLERNSVKYPLSKFYHANNDVVLISNYSGVIAKYDELVALYPAYITKNELSVGNFTNYEYVLTFGNYNAKETRRTKDAIISKPKILICSGVHGYEKSSVMGLYALVKSLCESDFALHNLNGNTVIKIIPIVCPWGYDNNSRLNEQGVNINRNFASIDWTHTAQGDNYSGAIAGDQPETQVVQNWINANTDAVLMFDWHNSQYVSEISCLLADNTDDLQVFKKKYLQAIESVIPYWQIDRGLNNSNVYAYSASSVVTGTTKNYAKDKGILSCTLETSWNVGNTGKDSLETINTNAEVMGNLLIGVESYYEI